jgi:phosphoribosylglycinamide formyltransferase-1
MNEAVSSSTPFRLAVLGSGKGSNFAAIAEACQTKAIPAEVAFVISDVPDAGILARARAANIESWVLPPSRYRTKLEEPVEMMLIEELKKRKIDLIVLAGFMRILKGAVLREFANRVINIHPSLLPSFPGLEAWKQALDYGVKHTGVTVHFVDQGIDTGPIIAQATVPVMEGDTAETLHARIQEQERLLYPVAIGSLASGKVIIQGRQTRLAL